MLNTGERVRKSSCFDYTITFLQYKKNIAKNIMFIAPGGIKNKFIWKMFAIIINVTIGPSIMSINTKASVLSSIPRSFENLLTSRPVGVTSKYPEGHLTSP